MIMSYTLRQVKTGWEIQNGSSITVTVPDLKSVEKAVTMLAENSKMTVGEMLTKKPAVKKAASKKAEEEEEEEEEGEKTLSDSVSSIFKTAKKPLTVAEIIERINPDADDDEKKSIRGIMSVLGRKKILKRKKNDEGIFAYSAKK
jgi:chorismate-pyruvate lyase